MKEDKSWLPHSSHWGAFFAKWENKQLHVKPHPINQNPNQLINNFPNSIRHRARVGKPMVRKGWLENGPGPSSKRGTDEYVPVSWDKAIHLVTKELKRVQSTYGAEAIFGGSYGWSSAGRFHHAQSQVHRFLNIAMGGYVRSLTNYSCGAALILFPYILGDNVDNLMLQSISWQQIIDHTDIVLAFGGLPLKNSIVSPGGASNHLEPSVIKTAAERGCQFYSITPLKSDLTDSIHFDWLGVAPGTDTALMLAMMHTLVSENLQDQAFLDKYTTGWPKLKNYLLGKTDGIVKDAHWAARICQIDADKIAQLARSLVGKRVVVSVAYSLQRAEHGEQPVWAALALACVLGQPGLPGGGYIFGLGSMGKFGRRKNAVRVPSLDQGLNNVKESIPVARISDMLLHPGEKYEFNGETLTYPNVKLAYWAGGNPFHHHQDLGRLTKAFQQLDTLIIHEIAWTATAQHADIVLPATMTLERNDMGGSSTDELLVAMKKIVQPYKQAKNDYEIFSALAEKLGCKEAFTEGRTEEQWLQHMYQGLQQELHEKGFNAPDFNTFWHEGFLKLPTLPDDGGIIAKFRHDPKNNPLNTQSGLIELNSEQISAFNYKSCPGHPTWIEPKDKPCQEFPLYLISNQPHTKLHGQMDYGTYSDSAKRKGREVCTIHPKTAAAKGIKDGDTIRVFNTRGSCLAVAELSKDILTSVIRIPTGAWYDPEIDERGLPFCVHGNPNVLTRDVGTSSLGQGTTAQITAVQIEKYDKPVRPVKAFDLLDNY